MTTAKVKKVNLKTKKWEEAKTLIVVDVSAVARTKFIPLTGGEAYFKGGYHKRKTQQREMSWIVNGEKMNTSAMYGIFQLFSMYGLSHDYIFCFDSPKNLLKAINSNYKANRVSLGNEYFDQVNTVYKILQESGFMALMEDGKEGDHLIYESVFVNYDNYDKIAVISNDKDLSALVDEKVVWIDTLKKRTDITVDNYEEVLGCPYNSILLKKAMVGDDSDEIKGIHKFGDVSFLKFLQDENLYGTDFLFNESEIIKNAITLTDVQKAEALESLQLIIPLKVNIDARYRANVNTRVFRAFLMKYGMKSIIKLFEGV